MATFGEIENKVISPEKNYDSKHHGKIYDQEGNDDFNHFISGAWVETKNRNADVLTCLKYGVKEVYVRVHFMRSQKGKSVKIAFLSRSLPKNEELKTINYSISNDNLVQLFPVSFTIDDYTKVDEDDICEYIFEVKLGEHKYSPNKILEVHAVIYIPEIMKHLGWNEGAKVQERWFYGDSLNDPFQGEPNTNGLPMPWIMGFSRVNKTIQKNINLWSTSNAINQLRKEIEKMIKDGLASYPTAKHKKTSFGTINGMTKNTSKIKKGTEVVEKKPLFDEYYFQSFVHDEPWENTAYLDLDDFYATVANCTFRFVAQGFLEYIDESSIQVNMNVVNLYMRDGFDFIGMQPLGFWSLKKKDVSRTPGKSYRLISNASYRNYREKSGKGSDFFNYSTFFAFPVNKKFML